MAIGILAAEGSIDKNLISDYFLIGELSLDGAIKPVRGALPIAMAANRLQARFMMNLRKLRGDEAANARSQQVRWNHTRQRTANEQTL